MKGGPEALTLLVTISEGLVASIPLLPSTKGPGQFFEFGINWQRKTVLPSEYVSFLNSYPIHKLLEVHSNLHLLSVIFSLVL